MPTEGYDGATHMAKKVATVKQTGGGGFSFENKVAAHYAVQMLLANEILGSKKGIITRIDFQTRVKGWYLDDILLTLQSNKKQSHIAFSVKSNSQFDKTVAPSDFIKAIWEQALHIGSNVFDRNSDMMGLITSCQPAPQKEAIQKILNLAKQHAPKELEQEVHVKGYTSKEVRSLFENFKCPKNLAGNNGDKLGPAQILKYLYIIEFDFEDNISNNENQAITFCRDFLRNNTNQEARKLWHSILDIVNSIRIVGGYIDRNILVNKLRSLYELKDFPDYASDWANLRKWSKQNIEVIKSEIGGSLILPKDNQQKELSIEFKKSNVVALLGNSGSGKTVLAKLYTQNLFKNNTVVWINSDELKNGQVFTSNSISGLKHSVNEVLANFTDSAGLLVVDRVERLRGDNDFQQLKKLFNAISNEDSWKVLITCRIEHWQRIQMALSGLNNINNIKPYTIGYLEKDELALVYESFPQIKNLSNRAQLGQLIRVPKIIDLLARGLQNKQLNENVDWIGETDIINWLWESIKGSCEEGYSLISIIQKIAEAQADTGEFTTPITQYKPDEASYLKTLDDEGICTENSGHISFQHDLYADWARCKNIIANESDIENYLADRSLNPFWHKAIRLYGLYLIEQKPDVNDWCNTINRYDFIKDYLLDSIIFATNSGVLLEKVYSLLIANNGELLTRLLKRFLIIATCPNPNHILFASTIGNDYASLARTLDRMPLWIYWPTVILFLSKHKDDLISVVPSEIAEIAKTWLRWTPLDFPFRKEAAKLALLVGNATYEKRKAHPYSSRDKQDKLRYSAALSAALEFPDEVAELALKASGRIVPDDVASGIVGDYKKPGSKTTVHHVSFSVPAKVPEPWPDGPKNRVDDAFQKVCLSTDSLLPLIKTRPQIVEEVILALIIELKTAESGYNDYHWSDEDIGLQYLHSEFYPRGWHKGPFLNFLRYNQQYGIDMIVRLVDFETERLLEVHHNDNNTQIELIVNNETKRYVGSAKIYNWHRGDPWCADVISSALMALEKYIYECVDKKKNISEILELLLSQSKSIAFLGLACEIGRYRPELFISILKPLLAIPELYFYEECCVQFNSGNSILVATHPEIQQKMQEWENMPHRKIPLMNIATYLFLNDKSLELFFLSFKDTLEDRLKANPDEGKITEKIKSLIPIFDRKNWKETKTAEDKNVWQYLPPKQLQEEAEAKLLQIRQRQIVLCFPMHCRRLLNKEINMKDKEVEPFWQHIKQIKGFTFNNDDDILSMTVDAIAGGIAVLIKNHYEWLKAHSAYMVWCIEWIVDLIANPPPKERFNFATSAGDIYWDSFISEIMPILWSEDPDSKQWRKLVAKLICLRHYDSMNLLMKSAYQLRSKLGNAFYQLVSLVLLHATVGNRLQFEFQPDTKEVIKSYKRITKRISSHKKKFIKNSLDYNISTWALNLVNRAELIPYKPHRRGIRIPIKGTYEGFTEEDTKVFYRKRPEVDLQLISKSFKELFSIEDAKDTSEQTTWLQFWEQLLICRLAFNQCFDENGAIVNIDEHEGEPSWMSDSDLLQPIAKFIIRMKNTNLVKILWKPIMDLGPSEHYFIKSFLSWFFFYGFETDYDESFIAVWKELLDDFHNSNRWYLNKSSTQGHNICEIWQCLLGINPRIHFNYNERHQRTIHEMKDYYCQWAKEKLASDAYSTMYFSELLKYPVAELIRLESLAWIKEAANKANKWWWKEEGLVASLAELLSFSWEYHKDEFSKNKEADSSFKELLQLLVNKQHPVAIDLQSRLAELN